MLNLIYVRKGVIVKYILGHHHIVDLEILVALYLKKKNAHN